MSKFHPHFHSSLDRPDFFALDRVQGTLRTFSTRVSRTGLALKGLWEVNLITGTPLICMLLTWVAYLCSPDNRIIQAAFCSQPNPLVPEVSWKPTVSARILEMNCLDSSQMAGPLWPTKTKEAKPSCQRQHRNHGNSFLSILASTCPQLDIYFSVSQHVPHTAPLSWAGVTRVFFCSDIWFCWWQLAMF